MSSSVPETLQGYHNGTGLHSGVSLVGSTDLMVLSDAVEDVLQSALHEVVRERNAMVRERALRENMNPEDRYRFDSLERQQRRSSGTLDESTLVPFLRSLQTLMPDNSDIVYRALQILHEKRLSLLVGNRPVLPPSGASRAEFELRWREKVVSASGMSPEGPWIDPSTRSPAATYFSIASERKSQIPYVCVLPGLVNTADSEPIAVRSRIGDTLTGSPNFDSSSASSTQGICTCPEFRARADLEGSPQGEGLTLYCKHLLAVRLSQLQFWHELRIRHVTGADLGKWLIEALQACM